MPHGIFDCSTLSDHHTHIFLVQYSAPVVPGFIIFFMTWSVIPSLTNPQLLVSFSPAGLGDRY